MERRTPGEAGTRQGGRQGGRRGRRRTRRPRVCPTFPNASSGNGPRVDYIAHSLGSGSFLSLFISFYFREMSGKLLSFNALALQLSLFISDSLIGFGYYSIYGPMQFSVNLFIPNFLCPLFSILIANG